MAKREQRAPESSSNGGNGQSETSAETAAAAAAEQAAAEADLAAVGRSAASAEAPTVVATARAIDPDRARRAACATIHARWRFGLDLGTIPAEAWPYVLAWLALSWRQGYEQASSDAMRMLTAPEPAPKPAPAPAEGSDAPA